MIDITLDSVRTGLLALVEQEGEDFIYEKNNGACTYTRQGKGDCLVGRFLIAEGVSVERLEAADRSAYGLRAPALLRLLEDEGVITVTDPALGVLDIAQDFQDSGESWGRSVNYALTAVKA